MSWLATKTLNSMDGRISAHLFSTNYNGKFHYFTFIRIYITKIKMLQTTGQGLKTQGGGGGTQIWFQRGCAAIKGLAEKGTHY